MRALPILAVVLTAGFGLSPPLPSQVFRTATEAVRVSVLVSDGRRPVAGLRAEDFDIRDNGILQKVTAVVGQEAALDVTLVLDASGSLAGFPLEHLKASALDVVAGLRPGDRVGIVAFADTIRTLVAATPNFDLAKQAIPGIEPAGNTAFLDALYVAFRLQDEAVNQPVLFLLSDGRDNRSWLSNEQVARVASESDGVLYAVTVNLQRPQKAGDDLVLVARTRTGRDLLRSLVAGTGGRLLTEDGRRGLTAALLELLDEARSRYVVMYTPQGVPHSGWHRLDVGLRDSRGRVTARPGYMVR
jgi:VWFA-related protein